MEQVPQDRTAVAVLGAGLMGHGIAQAFMTAGFEVSLWDPDADVLTSAPDRIATHLAVAGIERDVDVRLARTLPEAVDGAGLVIEAAPEKMSVKQDLVRQVEDANDDCILASNTSVLRITEIAEAARQPERIVGTHWWNPPYLIHLVEVVRGERTADSTVEQVSTWLRGAGKTPVEVYKDVPGFVGNRMQFALVREAAHIVEEGICSPETVDLVTRMTFGRRWPAVGPLENSDFIGLDLVKAIMDYLAPSLSTAQSAPALFERLLAEGHAGARAGRGVYEWPEGARDEVERRLLEHLLATETSSRPEDGPSTDHSR